MNILLWQRNFIILHSTHEWMSAFGCISYFWHLLRRHGCHRHVCVRKKLTIAWNKWIKNGWKKKHSGKEKQTVHLKEEEKTMKISTSVTLHFSCCNVEWCVWEKKNAIYMYYLVPSLSVLLSQYFSTHTHTFANSFFGTNIYGCCIFYQFIAYIGNNSSLNSHYHSNELVRTMNSVEKSTFWIRNGMECNNAQWFFFRSAFWITCSRRSLLNFILFYFKTIFTFISFHFMYVNLLKFCEDKWNCGVCPPAFAL